MSRHVYTLQGLIHKVHLNAASLISWASIRRKARGSSSCSSYQVVNTEIPALNPAPPYLGSQQPQASAPHDSSQVGQPPQLTQDLLSHSCMLSTHLGKATKNLLQAASWQDPGTGLPMWQSHTFRLPWRCDKALFVA